MQGLAIAFEKLRLAGIGYNDKCFNVIKSTIYEIEGRVWVCQSLVGLIYLMFRKSYLMFSRITKK